MRRQGHRRLGLTGGVPKHHDSLIAGDEEISGATGHWRIRNFVLSLVHAPHYHQHHRRHRRRMFLLLSLLDQEAISNSSF
jgi:hypothetical protein